MARVNNVCCNQFTLNLCSYNCRGFNFVKREYINRLLTKCDILLLQEHWLAETQLSDLASISDMFLYHGMSGFGNEKVLIGHLLEAALFCGKVVLIFELMLLPQAPDVVMLFVFVLIPGVC